MNDSPRRFDVTITDRYNKYRRIQNKCKRVLLNNNHQNNTLIRKYTNTLEGEIIQLLS